ncbi:MAG: RDD family protein [Oxalobacteraceae bacterium]|jgi:uncharacterized RDD family membrane protein YckC|nr:RDD family protein [Oxalobacteraceae bacterium]
MTVTQKAAFGGTPSEFGPRAVAYLIDLLLGALPPIVVALVGLPLAFSDALRPLSIFLFLIAFLYLLIFPIVNFLRQATRGATFGKSRKGLRLVVDVSGQPIGLLYALLRSGIFWILNLLSGGIFMIVDYLLPAFSVKRQRVVDKIIGTVVVTIDSASVATTQSPSSTTQQLPPPQNN